MPLVALAPPGGSNDLDRYELLFRFAAGGMAEVFVARQRGEGGFLRPVAIKRMLPALAEEPKFVEMFLDEARLAAHVQSPYVVSTLDCGKDEEGSPYIVMELVVGVSLSQALRACVEAKRHVPLDVFAEVIAQTALGLHDAHHARTPTGQPLEIVHRDVSPQNVLVGIDGRARLTDFGVARALERVTRTATGEVKGKLSYFSPEQARMEAIDHRSDIFALGIVAWETLALERLFSRDNPMAALQAILHERIPDVREHNPDVPEAMAMAVARALERDVSRRYPDARSFADALRAAVGTPATAAAVGRWVEQSGGPRLATFRKKIETSFRADEGPTEVSISTERERSSPSGASSASFGSAPESRLVGSLGTLPDRAPEPDAAVTEVRVARTPASTPLAASPITNGPITNGPITNGPITNGPITGATSPIARDEAPSRSRSLLFGALGLVVLVSSAGLYALTREPSASTPPTSSALAPTTPPVSAPSSPTTTSTLELAPTAAPTLEPARSDTRGPATRTRSDARTPSRAPEATQLEATQLPTSSPPTAVEAPRIERGETTAQEVRETPREPTPREPTPREPTPREPTTSEPTSERTEPRVGHETPTTAEEPSTPPSTSAGSRLRVGTGAGRLRGSGP